MSIDRVGKGVGGAAVTGAVAAEPAAAVAEAFQVDRAAASSPTGQSPLDRLRGGEIDLSQYLDLRVEQATVHLEGKLSPDRLSFVRESLRVELESDPMLVELVEKATGASLEKPSHGG